MDKTFINPGLKSKVTQRVQAILNRVHPSPEKRYIRESLQRLNFACPYCGDSSTDERKKRGNLYWEGLGFHCFNCGTHKDLDGFLADYEENFEGEQRFQIIDYIKEHKSKVVHVEPVKFELFEKLEALAVPVAEFYTTMNVYRISKTTKRAFPYLKSRVLTHKLDRFAYDPRKQMLYVLNLNASGDKVIGYQTRDLTNTRSAKYLSYNLEKMYKLLGKELNIESEEEIDRLNKVSMLFGMLAVNLTYDFTIFEGPIDAMFMSNSIALTGKDKKVFDFDELPTVRYLFDNDTVGKAAMIEKLKARKRVFLWDKFLRDHGLQTRKIKDMNDLVRVCWEKKTKKPLQNMEAYFSDNPTDIVYL